MTLGHSLEPAHKVTFVVGSVLQPVPLGVLVSDPPSSVKGMVVVPASVFDEGITQPESANELDASQPPMRTTRAAESRRVLMATPPSTRTRARDKFFGDAPAATLRGDRVPRQRATEDDGLLHPAPRTVRS